MKNSQRCPKCQGTDIIRIPGELGEYGVGNAIRVGWTFLQAVKVTRYVCASCGFTEEWIDAANDLAKLRNKFKPTT